MVGGWWWYWYVRTYIKLLLEMEWRRLYHLFPPLGRCQAVPFISWTQETVYFKKVIKIKLLFLCQYGCQVKISGRLLIIVQKVFVREVTWDTCLGISLLSGLGQCATPGWFSSGPHGNICRSHAVSRCILTLW